MARADTGDSNSRGREIRLIEEEDGRWSAIDEDAGVASQGETRAEALANLDEAVPLHRGEIGEPVTDADLRALGIDGPRCGTPVFDSWHRRSRDLSPCSVGANFRDGSPQP